MQEYSPSKCSTTKSQAVPQSCPQPGGSRTGNAAVGSPFPGSALLVGYWRVSWIILFRPKVTYGTLRVKQHFILDITSIWTGRWQKIISSTVLRRKQLPN